MSLCLVTEESNAEAVRESCVEVGLAQGKSISLLVCIYTGMLSCFFFFFKVPFILPYFLKKISTIILINFIFYLVCLCIFHRGFCS